MLRSSRSLSKDVVRRQQWVRRTRRVWYARRWPQHSPGGLGESRRVQSLTL